ncbi:uncharacterized protein MELLADRAFT_90111 [Melampsora larici-populina 98AG31]|uniref:Uncharacterized protein n=1 Tax=Melampsora larici-populina (strain 98AG31 / pathotype 3-4-7) TaxID=747676 RepID=F4RVP6_MELLP|nr:uncharacterized protein MELLADRAFT_90111 [Melampsora larici-populina 98AG31]EGG03394.1 hypothetical protein MELLADRAFT_90111 [Melampsora larici-populina 98AG31]
MDLPFPMYTSDCPVYHPLLRQSRSEEVVQECDLKALCDKGPKQRLQTIYCKSQISIAAYQWTVAEFDEISGSRAVISNRFMSLFNGRFAYWGTFLFFGRG